MPFRIKKQWLINDKEPVGGMNTIGHSYLILSRKTTLLKAKFMLPEDSNWQKKGQKSIDQVMQHFMGNDLHIDNFILVPLTLVVICLNFYCMSLNKLWRNVAVILTKHLLYLIV